MVAFTRFTSISTAGASGVTFKMRKRGSDVLTVDHAGVIDSPTRVSYQFVAPQLDDPGSYKLELELQFVDGPERVPTEGFKTVIIEENLGCLAARMRGAYVCAMSTTPEQLSDRQVLIMAIRALLRRDPPDRKGFHDFDVEAVLNAAAALGLDTASENQRAIDAASIPAAEFDRKWGGT